MLTTQESKNSEDINIVLKITGRFATVTQHKLNVDKTNVWGTTEIVPQSVRILDLSGEHLDVVSKLKSWDAAQVCKKNDQ